MEEETIRVGRFIYLYHVYEGAYQYQWNYHVVHSCIALFLFHNIVLLLFSMKRFSVPQQLNQRNELC
jgi:hypothetical protein